MINVSTLTLDEIKMLYPIVSRYDAESGRVTGATNMAQLFRVQSEMFARLKVEDPHYVQRDRFEIEAALSDAARTLRAIPSAKRAAASAANGRKGGAKGGRPGPSLESQAAVVWTTLASAEDGPMSLGPRLLEYMLETMGPSPIGLTPDSAAQILRKRAGKRTSAWITRDARIV